LSPPRIQFREVAPTARDTPRVIDYERVRYDGSGLDRRGRKPAVYD
jgi:hypothetical protein